MVTLCPPGTVSDSDGGVVVSLPCPSKAMVLFASAAEE
jgi:hypothetical protein